MSINIWFQMKIPIQHDHNTYYKHTHNINIYQLSPYYQFKNDIFYKYVSRVGAKRQPRKVFALQCSLYRSNILFTIIQSIAFPHPYQQHARTQHCHCKYISEHAATDARQCVLRSYWYIYQYEYESYIIFLERHGIYILYALCV